MKGLFKVGETLNGPDFSDSKSMESCIFKVSSQQSLWAS